MRDALIGTLTAAACLFGMGLVGGIEMADAAPAPVATACP